MFLWMIQFKNVFVVNHGLNIWNWYCTINFFFNPNTNALDVCILWHNIMQVWILYPSFNSVLNVNHFISVTSYIYYVSYSYTYLNKLILQIR